jgi:hypothetical protein
MGPPFLDAASESLSGSWTQSDADARSVLMEDVFEEMRQRLVECPSISRTNAILEPCREATAQSSIHHGSMLGVGKLRDSVHVLSCFKPFGRYASHQLRMSFGIGGRIENVAEAEVVVSFQNGGVAVFLEEYRRNEVVGMKVSSIVIRRETAKL